MSRDESNLPELIKFAWELGLAAGHVEGESQHAAIAHALAAKLNANAWTWQAGRLTRLNAVSTSDSQVDWLERRYHSLTSSNHPSPELNKVAENSVTTANLRRLVEEAFDLQTQAVEVLAFTATKSTGSGVSHRLVWLSALPDGAVEKFEFARADGLPPFSDSDVSTVQLIAGSVAETLKSNESERRQCIESSMLPKRQREVLELLLQGASIKEIASYLGISPYTVKDYSTALYRHFEVCGRVELAAMFLGADTGNLRAEQRLELSHPPLPPN